MEKKKRERERSRVKWDKRTEKIENSHFVVEVTYIYIYLYVYIRL